MGKPSSYLFELYFKNNNLMIKSTSDVWDKIIPTQENYPLSLIPRSFKIKLGNKEMWVHPNATKHIDDEIVTNWNLKNSTKILDIKLYGQLILFDFYQTLRIATKNNINYDKITKVGNWEFIFREPRKNGDLPVINHALFLGWNHKED